MNRHNPDVIPRDSDYDSDEDRPDDERFSLNSVGRDERSSSSHGTYKVKDGAAHGSLKTPKRSAQKAPSIEPIRKLYSLQSIPSELPPSSSSPNFSQPNDGVSAIGGQELLLGLAEDGVIRAPFFRQPSNQQLNHSISKPPGFNSPSSESQRHPPLGKRNVERFRSNANLDTTIGQYDDLPPDNTISNILEGMSLDSTSRVFISTRKGEQTTLSSLTGPSGTLFAADSEMSVATNVTSRSGNPRSILNERYQKKYNRSFTKKDFVSIRDASEGDHIPRFTSTFVCPETGECFLSGELVSHDSGSYVLLQNGMNWYMKKSTAEFAAAGRVEDCFRFRSGESGRNGLVAQFCVDTPFLKRSRGKEEDKISSFLNSRACDANARDRVVTLMKKSVEE